MKTRLYKNLVEAVIEALGQIFQEQQQADDVVAKLLKSNPKWGSRDRRFIANTIYEVVRWYRLYYEIQGEKPLTKEDWWSILAISWVLDEVELPDWEELNSIDVSKILDKATEVRKIRKINASIPDWLDDLGDSTLGEQWEKTVDALNQPAQVCLRCNTLKTTLAELQEALTKEGIATSLHNDIALVLNKRQKITHSKTYKKGWFEVQDISSQQVAIFLDVNPNMTVVDACAGAGGKSLHLAALMENKGKLTALDVSGHKLKELRNRSTRAGIKILNTITIDSNNTLTAIKPLYNTADRLLLDVPCTGLGVLRRNPDAKWKLTPDFVETIQATQQKILQEYSKICKVGGKIVYATCSILALENQLQIKAFLASPNGQGFQLVQDKTILPQDDGFDGFYMALLERIA